MKLEIAIAEANQKALTQGMPWYVVLFDFGYAPVAQRFLDNRPMEYVYKAYLDKDLQLVKEVTDG